MAKIIDYIKKNKVMFFACYAPIHFIWFLLLENWTDRDFTILHCGLDEVIPFVKWFIIPYYLWFPYIVVSVLWFYFFSDRSETVRLYTILVAGMAISLLIYTIWPNAVELRPDKVVGDDALAEFVRNLYKVDTDTNVCPSLHVYNTICIMTACFRNAKLRGRKVVMTFITLLSLLIVTSTMFLKQHSFIDVVAAFILYAVLYIIIYVCWKKESKVS